MQLGQDEVSRSECDSGGHQNAFSPPAQDLGIGSKEGLLFGEAWTD